MLGIGIITYNSLSLLSQCVQSVRTFTFGTYMLYVSDDGSTDGTHSFIEENKLGRSWRHKGVAHNRNRILRHLFLHEKCSSIIMLDDDAIVTIGDWHIRWHDAAIRHGLVFFSPHVGGDVMTYNLPSGGHCMAISRHAFRRTGYFDIDYDAGWGYEEHDYRLRFERMNHTAIPALSYGVIGGGSGRFASEEKLAGNKALFESKWC